MAYRTRTYIAAEWDGDSEAVKQFYKWKESNYWSFDFVDAHDLTQARDSSLNCSIKASLKKRLDVSKTFVLIVGDNTASARSGSCQYCKSYNSYSGYCTHGYYVDYRSFIEYECDMAVKDGLKIVVIYNATVVNRAKCPTALKDVGTHLAIYNYKDNVLHWNYQAIKDALS